jgi:tetratricopeptide (TPR) repeat protein
VYIYQENWTEAEKALQRSEKLFTDIGSDDFLPELKRRWGDYHLQTGQLEQALSYCQESIQMAIAQEARPDEGISYRILGEILWARGEPEEAESALLQSLHILTELESEYEAAKTRLSLARLWSIRNAASVQEYLHLAINSFQKMGAKADLARAEALLTSAI